MTKTQATVLNDASASDRDRRRNWWNPRFTGPMRMRRVGEKEAFVLTLICALDMITTLFWVVSGLAIESNGLLAWTFNHHPVAFVLVKLAAFLPALILAPKLAQRHPTFTVWLLRVIIVAYIGWYVMNVR